MPMQMGKKPVLISCEVDSLAKDIDFLALVFNLKRDNLSLVLRLKELESHMLLTGRNMKDIAVF
jgi:hypothetical protein